MNSHNMAVLRFLHGFIMDQSHKDLTTVLPYIANLMKTTSFKDTSSIIFSEKRVKLWFHQEVSLPNFVTRSYGKE